MAKKRKKKQSNKSKTKTNTPTPPTKNDPKPPHTGVIQPTNQEETSEQASPVTTAPSQPSNTAAPGPMALLLGTGQHNTQAVWFHWMLNLVAAIVWVLSTKPLLARLIQHAKVPATIQPVDAGIAIVAAWLLLRVLTIPLIDLSAKR